MTPEARIGDREREAATAILTEHYAAGRLDTEEHAERLDAIWSAKTRADLDVVFWDLPRAVVPPKPAAPVRRASQWRFPVAMFLIALVVLSVALHIPWWVWLIGVVVLMKSRGWRHCGWQGHRPRGHLTR